jgi:tRNA nucleotidyltransferase/poly(A) polymerase
MKIKKYKNFTENKKNKTLWDIIPQSVKDLNNLFNNSDKKLYLVGGAIRDFINNEQPKDFDLCTDATPNEILKIIGNKYKTTEQGKSFGVIVVYSKDQPMGMEIATFREDIYGDKLGFTRNPNVKFSTIEKDVMRRDIPFNAMFYDLNTKKIIDLVGGLDDLKNKITRFIGNPDDRIMEDPLRLLRLIRFSCRYNFKIDINTKNSIIKNKHKLYVISKERIWEEFKKSWSQVINFNDYLNFFTEFDMWEQVFTGSKININLIESKNFVIIMANLFKNNTTKDLEKKLVQEYKISNSTDSGKIATQIVFLIDLLRFPIEEITEMYKRKVQCSITNDTILEWLNVNHINDSVKIKFVEFKPSISSKELMSKGFKGLLLGKKIKELEIVEFKKLLSNKF